jgi:hypothetical protein
MLTMINDMSKSIYVMQPYQVGSKNAKSLVILIPARIVKEFNINTSTVFMLRKNIEMKTITLETIHVSNEKPIRNENGEY